MPITIISILRTIIHYYELLLSRSLYPCHPHTDNKYNFIAHAYLSTDSNRFINMQTYDHPH